MPALPGAREGPQGGGGLLQDTLGSAPGPHRASPAPWAAAASGTHSDCKFSSSTRDPRAAGLRAAAWKPACTRKASGRLCRTRRLPTPTPGLGRWISTRAISTRPPPVPRPSGVAWERCLETLVVRTGTVALPVPVASGGQARASAKLPTTCGAAPRERCTPPPGIANSATAANRVWGWGHLESGRGTHSTSHATASLPCVCFVFSQVPLCMQHVHVHTHQCAAGRDTAWPAWWAAFLPRKSAPV